MVLIPIKNPLQEAIESILVKKEHRPYIGYSGVGHHCARYLWYSFRWAYEEMNTPRMLRLWSRGDQEEEIVIKDLAKVGVEIENQQAEIVGPYVHIGGHIDGEAINVIGAPKTRHLFECKTANDKRFKQYISIPLEPNGHANTRLKNWDIKYYTQVNAYMKKRKLKRCLFVVTNKNTDERCYDRLHLDETYAELADEKALTVLMSPMPLDKIGNSTWFECKMCSAKDVCHFSKEPERNCRTCKHASIEEDGWSCDNGQNDNLECSRISTTKQRLGCVHYKLMEELKVG